MTAEHYAEADLTDPDWPTVRFVCTGGPEDVCRQWCADGCEESCLDYRNHRWADTGSCREMDWLDAVGWEETGWRIPEDDEQLDEVEMTADRLRPGRHLIETEWTGDDYIWRYPAEVPA